MKLDQLSPSSLQCVIFAGGYGTRLQEETELKPKPMVTVDGFPILLWIIRSYASYGVKDFVILCGYKGEKIDNFFKNLSEDWFDNDYSVNGLSKYSFSDRGLSINVTLLSTGEGTLTAGRLLQAKSIIKSNPFFCTYGDALADIDFNTQLQLFSQCKAPNLISVSRQQSRFGEVIFSQKTRIMEKFLEKPLMPNLVNIGYFILSSEVFSMCEPDKMFEDAVLPLLAKNGICSVYQHEGYWQPIDSIRDLNVIRELISRGDRPWDKNKI